jgi:hypothetical protein
MIGGGYESSNDWQTETIKFPYAGGGVFAFFDATYAEVSLGFWGGGGTYSYRYDWGYDRNSLEYDMSFTGFGIGVLGKYPFAISNKLSIFPLLGITYRIMLSVKDEDGNQYKNFDGDDASGDFSALWFRFFSHGSYFLARRTLIWAAACKCV